MYVLLKDFDNVDDKGFYIDIPNYSSYVEQALIELYYRGVSEGLVDYSTEYLNRDDIEVIEFNKWVSEKKLIFNNGKPFEILEELENNINESKVY